VTFILYIRVKSWPSEQQPPADISKNLKALGRRMMRFSPVVAIDAPADGLFLDVSGSERLFGSLQKLLARVSAALRKMNVNAALAIAPTPGAAWAIAHAGDDGKIIEPQGLIGALAPLPPRALRIDTDVSDLLHQLGIETIGQLLDLPRQVLPARFGAELLTRIDQALGHIQEPLIPLPLPCPIEAAMEFEGTIDSLEAIEWVLGQLLKQVLPQLVRRGLGARRIEVSFAGPHTAPVQKAIRLSRPSRDPKNLFNLLRCMLETVKTQWGFSRIGLSVPLAERIKDEQIALKDGEQLAAEKELAQLVERLRVRLGETHVRQARLVELHLPERAFAMSGADADTHTTGVFAAGLLIPATSKTNLSTPGQSGAKKAVIVQKRKSPRRPGSGLAIPLRPSVPLSLCPPLPRPLHLLQTPMEVRVMVSPSDDREGRPISFTCKGTVHAVAHAAGPERISGCWWDGHNKTRDYFDAEDKEGRRFWLFRVVQSGRWFVQGRFN
jgi:protein ImuB